MLSEIKKIFFSYSRTDAAFAVKLALDLKKAGFDVWIDQEDIRAGSEWDLQIEKALTTCDCLLFIQSERSVSSTNVLDEVYYALEENKKVIPVIISNCKPPFRINRLQHVSFIEDYENGLAELKSNLSGGPLPDIKSFDEKQPKRFAPALNVKYLFIVLLVAIVCAAFMFFNNKKSPPAETVKQAALLPENFTGEWVLTAMQPETAEKKGYLKIADSGNGKLNIKSSFQFYYTKTNDTAFLNVFNAYVECAACIFKNEMIFTDKQIGIGAQKYSILQQDGEDGKKKGDTVLNAGSNSSIRATATLHLINKDSAVIKVAQPDSIKISYGILVPPFEYFFYFKKAL